MWRHLWTISNRKKTLNETLFCEWKQNWFGCCWIFKIWGRNFYLDFHGQHGKRNRQTDWKMLALIPLTAFQRLNCQKYRDQNFFDSTFLKPHCLNTHTHTLSLSLSLSLSLFPFISLCLKLFFYSYTLRLSRNFRTIKFNSFAHLKMKLFSISFLVSCHPHPFTLFPFRCFSLITINMTITKDFHLSWLSNSWIAHRHTYKAHACTHKLTTHTHARTRIHKHTHTQSHIHTHFKTMKKKHFWTMCCHPAPSNSWNT